MSCTRSRRLFSGTLTRRVEAHPLPICLGPRLPTLGTILTELARVCSGPRAEYADILNDILNYTDYSILNHTNYTTRCGDRPPCVALIVDDPTYDAGLNEGIVARLNVSIPGYVAPGIQIVYGNVGTEVDKAEKEVDQPYPYHPNPHPCHRPIQPYP